MYGSLLIVCLLALTSRGDAARSRQQKEEQRRLGDAILPPSVGGGNSVGDSWVPKSLGEKEFVSVAYLVEAGHMADGNERRLGIYTIMVHTSTPISIVISTFQRMLLPLSCPTTPEPSNSLLLAFAHERLP